MYATWSQAQAMSRLMTMPGVAKANHVLKLSPEVMSVSPNWPCRMPISAMLGVDPVIVPVPPMLAEYATDSSNILRRRS